MSATVQAAVAAILAGPQRIDYNKSRHALITLRGFSNTDEGTMDNALCNILIISYNPALLAESDDDQITSYIRQFNRVNLTSGLESTHNRRCSCISTLTPGTGIGGSGYLCNQLI